MRDVLVSSREAGLGLGEFGSPFVGLGAAADEGFNAEDAEDAEYAIREERIFS